MYKEIKGIIRMISHAWHQIENINEQLKIIERNQIKILDFKNKIQL